MNSFRALATKLDSFLLTAIFCLIAFSWLTGCSDGGSEYELQAAPTPSHSGVTAGSPTTGGTGGTTTNPPPGSAGNGGTPTTTSCQHLPYRWEMISLNGCMASPRMAGAIQDQLGGTTQLQAFKGKDFATSSGGPVSGQAFVLSKPDATECGPATLAMVSNSGSINIKVFRDLAGAPEEVDFFVLNTVLMDEVWSEVHGGAAPSGDAYYSLEFSSLMISAFECYKNTECALRKKLISMGKSLPPDLVKPQATASEVSSNGAFCGRMLVVAKSRP